ncbi:MAG: DUF4332 domain-containing protein [Candidatus Odinarchaeota archaeon]
MMFKIVWTRATSTHHKLALDVLRHLQGPNSANWYDLFLKHHSAYLEGAKDPDKKFHDFKNYVIHVRENYWGGAFAAAEEWYTRLVEELKNKKWKEAVYSAGVLSHYYCDPVQPFHTGQTEEEGLIHKNWEWGSAKLYEEYQDILMTELGGYPDVQRPAGSNWLTEMIKQGAEKSNPYYELMIDHYDVNRGRKDPVAGFDQDIKDEVAQLIGHAAVGFSRILEKAFEDAGVSPPSVGLTLSSLVQAMNIPKHWITRKLADRREKAIVDAMYEEFAAKGKVIDTLPPDDKEVRVLHAEEVLKVPIETLNVQKLKPTGTKYGQGKSPREKVKKTEPTPAPTAKKPVEKARKTVVEKPVPSADTSATSLNFYLEVTDPIADAPEIGSKTAERLNNIGIGTVKDFLSKDPEKIAQELAHRYIKAEDVSRWQQEARLAYRIPKIRGHDVQLLVRSGFTEPEQIASAKPEDLLKKVMEIVKSPDGERILRSGKEPDLDEVKDWITWAKQARE